MSKKGGFGKLVVANQVYDYIIVDLDKEKAMDIAKEKAADLKKKAQDLYDLAMEKGTPVIKNTAKELLETVSKVSKETIKKIEKTER